MDWQSLNPGVKQQYEKLKEYAPRAAIAYLKSQLTIFNDPGNSRIVDCRTPRNKVEKTGLCQPLRSAQPKTAYKPRVKTEAALQMESLIAAVLNCDMAPMPRVAIQALIERESGQTISHCLFRRVLGGLVTDKILIQSLDGKAHTFRLCPPFQRDLTVRRRVVEFWGKPDQRTGLILEQISSSNPSIRSFRIRLDNGTNGLSSDECLFPL